MNGTPSIAAPDFCGYEPAMLKFVTIPSLALIGTCWFTPSALAQDITGRWVSRGTTPQGGRYALTAIFDGKGKVETEAALIAPRGAAGSGSIRCSGSYKLDAGTIEYSWSSCRSCPTGKACGPFSTEQMGLGGPVEFTGTDTLQIGPESFKRDSH